MFAQLLLLLVKRSSPSKFKLANHRISELPSLRYGPVGSKTTMTGPLMVNSRDGPGKIYEKEDTRRRKKSVVRIFGGGRNRHNEAEKQRESAVLSKAERRVRFSLPPPEDATYTDAGDASTRDAYVNKHHSFLKSFSRSNIVFRPVTQSSERTNETQQEKQFVSSSVKIRRNNVEKTFKNTPLDRRQIDVNRRKKATEKSEANYAGSCDNYAGFQQYRESCEKYAERFEKYAQSEDFIKYVGFRKYTDPYCEKYAERIGKYAGGEKYVQGRRFGDLKVDLLQERVAVEVPVAFSPGVRNRVHPTGRYIRGTLSPTQNTAPTTPPCSPGGQALLKAAQNGEEEVLRDHLRRGIAVGIREEDLNAVDCSGRTVLSYIASNGSIDLLEIILQIPTLDPNKPDNEGNTPLHFAAQAGQVECLNCLLSRCRGVDIDARNNLGFTALMKAALQGRNKCAKLLLFAGANPTLRDYGRGFRADQWARFCGRYVCADVIEKHARQRLLERSTSYGSWGLEQEMGATVVNGKVIPVPQINSPPSNGLKSRLRKVFRTSSGPSSDQYSSARLVTQLTSAALCVSSPVLPCSGSVPPMVKSLIRPLTVPRLQITLVNNNGEFPNKNYDPNELDEEPLEKTVPSNGTTKVGNGTTGKVANGSISSQVTNGCVTKTGNHQENVAPSVVKPGRTKKKK